MGVHRIAQKSAPKTTARQQSIIQAGLKFLTQNFSLQNPSTNVRWMTSSISQLTAMSGNITVIMSLKITQQQRKVYQRRFVVDGCQ
jgi:hypothetical protein